MYQKLSQVTRKYTIYIIIAIEKGKWSIQIDKTLKNNKF